MKRFVALSDLHGTLPIIEKEADVMLIAGDILPLRIQSRHKESLEWFKNVFIPWVNSAPVKYVVLVAGNHDLWMENHPDEVRECCLGTKIEYLENEFKVYIFQGPEIYAIYGTPLCKPFGNWSFMKPLEEQRKIFDEVRSETKEVMAQDNEIGDVSIIKTIILSHDAPYGASDILMEDCPWKTGEHIGNKELRSLIEDIKPDICIHGHLHSTNHSVEKIGETCVYNVSILGEDYKQHYQPLYFML